MDGSQSIQQDLKALYDRGLFRQAWDLLEGQAGPPSNWQDPELRVIGARLLHQLGLGRTGDAVLLRTWRRWPAHPEVGYYYLRYLLNRRGPLAALQAMTRDGEAGFAGTGRHADWLALKALIHSCYRDWERAHALIDRAWEVDPGNRWTVIEQASILSRQDRYDEALALVEPLALAEQPYRPALQSTADLYQLRGEEERAIALLAPQVEAMESPSIIMQQHALLLSAQRPEAAAACLRRARELIPADLGMADWRLRCAEYEQAYLAGDYQAAIDALTSQRHHFFASVRGNLQTRRPDAARARLPVPFIRQHHMTCAPATFVAMARYWGHHFDHLEVADQICYDGTPASTERRWISDLGWQVREFELSLPVVTALIDRGVPIGLSTVEPGSAHMQALVGYDLYKGVYLLRDPWHPDIREMLIEGAHESYAASGPRCMVFMPPDKADLLTDITLPAERLYDHYYVLQLALERFDRDEALRCLEQLKQIDPDHRLTLWSRRSIASFDMDVATQLEVTDQLLKRYPEDLNLVAARAWALGALGRDEDKREYLRDVVRSGVRHPFLLQSLADELCNDQRCEKETRQLLEQILRQHPTSGQGLFTLAGLEWDQGNHEQACEYYRLASLVEPANERLAESYFRATRWIRAVETGLAYLRARDQELGRKSANASVTLALALQNLNRFDDAREVMAAALQRHPHNDWLIKEAVDLHISCGRFDDAETLLAESGGHMSELECLRKLGEVARARGDMEKAAGYWQKILALRPGQQSATTALAWFVQSRDGTDAALALVDQSLQPNPHDYTLRGLRVQLLEQWPAWQRSAALNEMAARFGNDTRVLLAAGKAALLSRQPAEADRYADAVLAIDDRHGPARLLKGDACIQRGDMAAAAEHYRQAIRKHVDTDDAFYRLVESCSGFARRQEALRFIHGELLSQVTFGNALLDFAEIAPRYLPDAEVSILLQQAVDQRPDLWQSWSAKAAFEASHGLEQQALITLADALQRYPMTPRLWVQRGQLQLHLGRLTEAEQDLRQALQINPAWNYAVTTLADILEAAQRHDEALTAIEAALSRNPDTAVLHGYRASLLRRLDRSAEAISALRSAVEYDPDYDWAWRQLQELTRGATEQEQPLAVAEALANRYRHSAALWRRCYLLTDDPGRELEFIERAIALRGHDPQLFIDRCSALLRQGRVRDAQASLATTRWPSGRPSEISGYEAWMQAHLGDLGEAIKRMQAVLEQDPGYAYGWQQLAEWHGQAGNQQEAIRCARRWLELSPRNTSALVQLAEQCLQQCDDNPALREEAQHYLERALTLDVDSEYILLTLLDSYLDGGQHDDARALLGSRDATREGAFVIARRLRLAVLEHNSEAALGWFRKVLGQPESNHWVVTESQRLLKELGVEQQASGIVDELAGSAATAPVGIALAARWAQARESQEKIHKRLSGIKKQPQVWAAAMDYLLQDTDFTVVARLKFAKKWRKTLAPYAGLRRRVIWLLADQRDWKSVISWSSGHWREPDNSMDMLYLYAFALRLENRWPLAQQVTERAEGLSADGVADNVRLWRALDLLGRGEKDAGHYRLVRINREELAPLERYAFDVLKQIMAMQDIPLPLNMARYQKAFAAVRAEFGSMMWEAPALALRKRLRGLALASLPASPWLRLWWWWRLQFLM